MCGIQNPPHLEERKSQLISILTQCFLSTSSSASHFRVRNGRFILIISPAKNVVSIGYSCKKACMVFILCILETTLGVTAKTCKVFIFYIHEAAFGYSCKACVISTCILQWHTSLDDNHHTPNEIIAWDVSTTGYSQIKHEQTKCYPYPLKWYVITLEHNIVWLAVSRTTKSLSLSRQSCH